ncbi:MAG TPA: UDP-N-acetylmuramate--alanine ligase [Burkholderiales bacterium]|nr:UDP-N-acetylmuramate--alanine ligase [Burkholderiales bacterium]
MAEDGIEDHALAKRKAARQIGAAGLQQLPDNGEIDIALKSYRMLYCEGYADELRELRRRALAVMDGLARFNPHLVGPVLNGSAGRFATIQLQLFVDNTKDVEIELINCGVNYRNGASRLYCGKLSFEVPTLAFVEDGVDVCLILLSSRDLRCMVKSDMDGKPVERASRAAVAALVAAE